MTQINRRQFLKNALALSITTATPWQVWASPTGGSDTRMVFIFLRGGYDALNTLVPYSSDFYYEQRPNIAIARPTEEDEHSAIALNDTWGLHPMLAQHLLPLYQAGELAIVPFCGTDFVSRSHFDAQDWIEWGQGRAPTGAETQSGFLNRLLTQLQKGQTNNKGISFTPHLTPIWQGSTAVDNNSLSIKDLKTNLSTDRQTLLQQLYTGHPLARLVTEGLSLQTMLTQEFDEEMIQASRQAVSSNGFAQSAQKVGKLLRDHPNYRLGFMDIGGWDTHVNQGSAQGALANKLQALGEGLVTLKNSLGDQWSKTLVIVMSEFGRTFAENGNKGTDHGHGSVLWLLGGAIQGGIKGEQIQLNRQTLHQARDLPLFNEYRSVLANLFQHSYGLTPTQLAQIFPNVQHQTFNLL